MEKVLTGSKILESKDHKLYVEKLVTVDLSKLSDLVKNDVIKKMYIMLKSKIKMPEITNLATNTTLNAKVNEVKNKIPNITNLATTTALTTGENKIPDRSKCITTPEFFKLVKKNFNSRLKQANLATKGDIVDFVKMTDCGDK